MSIHLTNVKLGKLRYIIVVWSTFTVRRIGQQFGLKTVTHLASITWASGDPLGQKLTLAERQTQRA